MKNKHVIVLMLFLLGLPFLSCHNKKPDFDKGNGTIHDPFVIEVYEDLFKLNHPTKYYYKLGNNIYNTNDVVIKDSIGDFYGDLNGKGYSIYGIKIEHLEGYSDSQEDILYSGLFGKMKSDSYIHNLYLKNVDITIDYNQFGHIGSLVGYMEEDSKIESIDITGSMRIDIHAGHIGGAVGTGETISNVYTDNVMTITSQTNALTIGGIVGHNRHSLTRGCPFGIIDVEESSNSEFENKDYAIGGVAGIVDGEIFECENKTSIFLNLVQEELNSHIGGIVGELNGKLSYSSSFGTISITSNGGVKAGGLSGVINDDGIVTKSIAFTSISYEGRIDDTIFLGAISGYAIHQQNASKLYYSQEMGLMKAIGNLDNDVLQEIEDHTINYYISGIELDYINGFYSFREGDYPQLLIRMFGD